MLAVQPLAELAERVTGGGRGNLGIELHRDRDLAVPQGDKHVYVVAGRGHQQDGPRVADDVLGDADRLDEEGDASEVTAVGMGRVVRDSGSGLGGGGQGVGHSVQVVRAASRGGRRPSVCLQPGEALAAEALDLG